MYKVWKTLKNWVWIDELPKASVKNTLHQITPIGILSIATPSKAFGRILHNQAIVELYAPQGFMEHVPGEIIDFYTKAIQLIPSQTRFPSYQKKGFIILKGKVLQSRTKTDELNLAPLSLMPCGTWTPSFQTTLHTPYLEPILHAGARHQFRMKNPQLIEELTATETLMDKLSYEKIDDKAFIYLLYQDILACDLRCIEAHEYLAEAAFCASDAHLDALMRAKKHFEIAVGIGNQALGKDFLGVLAWSERSNRPFLKALYGLAMTLWRLGDGKRSFHTFQRLLWLNPKDDLEVQFALTSLDQHEFWNESEKTFAHQKYPFFLH